MISKFSRYLTFLGLLPLFGAIQGCSSHASSGSPIEASELLELLQEDLNRHDPQAFSEVDLGEFRVTRTVADEQGTLVIKFRLYGVLPGDKTKEFEEKTSRYGKRMRDIVLGIVQRSDMNDLTAPRMGVLKSQLTRSINEMIRSRSLRDVVFSELTMERG